MVNMFKKRLNQKGYTLVELIITLAIIGIMIAPIYNAFLDANRVNLRSKRQISAAYLAQNVMEEVKGISTSDFVTRYGANYNLDSFVSDIDSTVTNGETLFDVNVVIDNMSGNVNLLQASTDTISDLPPDRGAFLTVTLPYEDASNTDVLGKITSTATGTFVSIGISEDTIDLNFTSAVPSNPTSLNTFVSATAGTPSQIWTYDDIEPVIIVDVIDLSNLNKDWTINVLNDNPNIVVDIKRYFDDGGEVSIEPDNASSGNIFIGNNYRSDTGVPSTVTEWFNVVVTVSHNGTVYERIESTIGK